MPKKNKFQYKFADADVLSMLGAAAQQTTHPGNLAFYQLCEEHYDAYITLPDSHPGRVEIALQIVDAINQKGGIFRKRNGTRMSKEDAMTKVKDRMRQIRKPKIAVPMRVHEHDVVFCVGGANHLYPGNPIFRSMIDQYFGQYYPDFDPTNFVKNFNNQVEHICERPPHQERILNELMEKV